MSAENITGPTGEICRTRGVYTCTNTKHGELSISRGEVFPLCPYGGHVTVWVLKDKK